MLSRSDLLTDDEVVRLVRIAVTHLGTEEIRFTGGEPLLRPNLGGIVERCAALAPRPRLSLTTNGIGLGWTAEALERAGLDRVNVSPDTLRPAAFKALTRRDRHHDVLQGLAAARAAGLTPVKVNAVLMPELNDDEAPELLAWPWRTTTNWFVDGGPARVSAPAPFGSARGGGRRPVPASTSRPSSSPTGRCRPSGADAPGVERNDVHRQNQE